MKTTGRYGELRLNTWQSDYPYLILGQGPNGGLEVLEIVNGAAFYLEWGSRSTVEDPVVTSAEEWV